MKGETGGYKIRMGCYEKEEVMNIGKTYGKRN